MLTTSIKARLPKHCSWPLGLRELQAAFPTLTAQVSFSYHPSPLADWSAADHTIVEVQWHAMSTTLGIPRIPIFSDHWRLGVYWIPSEHGATLRPAVAAILPILADAGVHRRPESWYYKSHWLRIAWQARSQLVVYRDDE